MEFIKMGRLSVICRCAAAKWPKKAMKAGLEISHLTEIRISLQQLSSLEAAAVDGREIYLQTDGAACFQLGSTLSVSSSSLLRVKGHCMERNYITEWHTGCLKAWTVVSKAENGRKIHLETDVIFEMEAHILWFKVLVVFIRFSEWEKSRVIMQRFRERENTEDWGTSSCR